VIGVVELVKPRLQGQVLDYHLHVSDGPKVVAWRQLERIPPRVSQGEKRVGGLRRLDWQPTPLDLLLSLNMRQYLE
jgi:hypothetical protein